MPRLLAVLLSGLFSLSLFAQQAFLVSAVRPKQLIVDAGATATFETTVRNGTGTMATDARIVYELTGEATIERLEDVGTWQCTIESKTAVCTNPFTMMSEDRIDVIVRAGATNGGASQLRMSAFSAQQQVIGEQHIAKGTLQSYHLIAVTTTADSGPGSLRAAIAEANGTNTAKIEFQLPAPVPSEGWFTIMPESPLPPITAESVLIDGTSQTRLTGDTNTRGPEIAIDGRHAHRGLEVHSPCMSRVYGLTLGHFDANQGLWVTKSRECTALGPFDVTTREVVGNYIGTDPTGTTAWPNRRGLRGDFGAGRIANNVISGNTYSGMWIWITEGRFDSYTIEDNLFGVGADGVTPLPNGAAGMLFGDRVSADVRRNVIANHPGMGIALARGGLTFVGIRQNSMRDNGGIGIDWGVDGVSPFGDGRNPDPPVLLASRYDSASNRTYFTFRWNQYRFPGPNPSFDRFDFYSNRGPDGDGETWIGEGNTAFVAEGSYEAWVTGDHRGKWVNAAVTSVPQFGAAPIDGEAVIPYPVFGEDSTSEFSNAVKVD